MISIKPVFTTRRQINQEWIENNFQFRKLYESPHFEKSGDFLFNKVFINKLKYYEKNFNIGK